MRQKTKCCCNIANRIAAKQLALILLDSLQVHDARDRPNLGLSVSLSIMFIIRKSEYRTVIMKKSVSNNRANMKSL
ncbi:MAG: hypothetical protein LUQ57_05870, partial [Methylococcaceae bacterium]|nr:hypothetical protein [Methylococcaceae bacterium]